MSHVVSVFYENPLEEDAGWVFDCACSIEATSYERKASRRVAWLDAFAYHIQRYPLIDNLIESGWINRQVHYSASSGQLKIHRIQDVMYVTGEKYFQDDLVRERLNRMFQNEPEWWEDTNVM